MRQSSHIGGRQKIVDRESNKKSDLIKLKSIACLGHTHFASRFLMNKGQCIFLSLSQGAYFLPTWLSCLFYFPFRWLGLYSSPSTVKLALETGTWDCRVVNCFLLLSLFEKGKLPLSKSGGGKMYWNLIDKHGEIWAEYIRRSSFPLCIISHNATFLINFISSLFSTLGKHHKENKFPWCQFYSLIC